MGKKQSRQNRGARTGGHERSAAAEVREQPGPAPAPEAVKAISEQVSHKRQRKFGHN